MMLYHGTAAERLERIFREGLFSHDSFIYLTNDSAVAELFAKQAGGRPVVLKVLVKDVSRLFPDLNMYDTPIEALTKKYGVDIDSPLWGHVEGPKHEGDWQTSIKEVNSVIYDGRIFPQDIEFGWNVA